MFVIYSFSAKTGAASTDDSFFVSRLIGNLIYSDFNEWSVERQNEFLDEMDFVVRKTAHMAEFFILCVLVFFSQKNLDTSFKNIVFPLLITIFYAISDEIHQYFVPNRSCQLKDVIIDSIGGILAIVCILLIKRIILKENEIKKSKNTWEVLQYYLKYAKLDKLFINCHIPYILGVNG